MAQYPFSVQDQVFHSIVEDFPILEPQEPSSVSFSNWKTQWSDKMDLLSLKETGFDWDYIERHFEGRMKIERRKTWYEKHRKTVLVVSAPSQLLDTVSNACPLNRSKLLVKQLPLRKRGKLIV
jgi:hypothetical protein